jgi:hypothetical protein
MSERYIMGVDAGVIADHMLDGLNRVRATHDKAALDAARRYAALLDIDASRIRSDRTAERGY